MVADLLQGLVVSVEIFVFTLLISLPLGIPLALARMSKNRVVSGTVAVWISIVRGTPLMLQIIFVYFSPYILFGMPLSRYPRLLATVLAFGLNYAAYFAEIYRGGIQSIDKGQMEAGRSLGLSHNRTLFHIIIPQAVRNVLPALGNEFVVVIKESSIVSIIGIADLMYKANTVRGNTFQPFEPLLVAAVVYFLLTFPLSKLLAYIERRMRKHD